MRMFCFRITLVIFELLFEKLPSKWSSNDFHNFFRFCLFVDENLHRPGRDSSFSKLPKQFWVVWDFPIWRRKRWAQIKSWIVAERKNGWDLLQTVLRVLLSSQLRKWSRAHPSKWEEITNCGFSQTCSELDICWKASYSRIVRGFLPAGKRYFFKNLFLNLFLCFRNFLLLPKTDIRESDNRFWDKNAFWNQRRCKNQQMCSRGCRHFQQNN